MSYTTVKAIFPGEKHTDLFTLKNSWGSAPYVWVNVTRRYLDREWYSCDCADDLWLLWKAEKIPFHHRAVLTMTYDRAYIAKADYERAAQDIRQFLEDFPPKPGCVNHWMKIAGFLESDPDYPGVGFWMTSVSEDPFDGDWNEEAESYDPPDWSGIYSVYGELDDPASNQSLNT